MKTAQMIVEAITEITGDGDRCRLIDMHHYIKRRFRVKLETTTISAAIRREVRPYIQTKQQGLRTVDNREISRAVRAHIYWIRPMTKEEIEGVAK